MNAWRERIATWLLIVLALRFTDDATTRNELRDLIREVRAGEPPNVELKVVSD